MVGLFHYVMAFLKLCSSDRILLPQWFFLIILDLGLQMPRFRYVEAFGWYHLLAKILCDAVVANTKVILNWLFPILIYK